MWRVVYIARSKPTAESIEKLLSNEGFLVRLKPVYKNLDDTCNYFEVLVPLSESEEVHAILMENGF